jgi:act minimal PKS acyl carrier protein
MSSFTAQDLKRILRSCGGVEDVGDLDGPALDTPVAELGYDSLAMLEVASIVQREYGVAIPDEALEYMTTPRTTVEYVNARLSEARVA